MVERGGEQKAREGDRAEGLGRKAEARKEAASVGEEPFSSLTSHDITWA